MLKGQTVDGFYNKKEEKRRKRRRRGEGEEEEDGGKTIMKAPAASSKPPFILRHDIDTAMLPVLLVLHHAIERKKQCFAFFW